MKRLLAVYKESEDLINIGAYQRGTNPAIDEAIDAIQMINDFTKQRVNETAPYEETIHRLESEFRGDD